VESVALKIIVPRANARDLLACESFLSALGGDGALTLEMGAASDHGNEVLFLLRGEARAVEHARAQLRIAYPQCGFLTLSADQDPKSHSESFCLHAEARLRDAAYLPIRTHISREGRITNDDLQAAADPMLSVLAAMDDLSEGERCLVRYVLRPMPADWSKYWRGMAGDVNERLKATPQGLGAQVLLPLGLALLVIGVLFALLALMAGRSLLLWLVTLVWMAVGMGLIWLRFRVPSPPDALLIKQKVSQYAFRVRIALYAWAKTEKAAQERLRQLQYAYRSYALAGGNSFVFTRPTKSPEIDDLAMPPEPRVPFVGFLHSPSAHLPILSVSELAALWHLPHGEAALQRVAYTSSKQLAPAAQQHSDGIHIGASSLQGRSTMAWLPKAALSGNVGLVAKTQSGKSNMLALLAQHIIVTEPEATVIVIDPHRTLVQQVGRLIPPEREAGTIYWNVADRERPFGLNLIDRAAHGNASATLIASDLFADKRISDIIDAFHEIWSDNWGPRMEDYMRGPLLTLATANEVMVRTHAFQQWLTEARTYLGQISAQIIGKRMDKTARDMADHVVDGFVKRPRPARPGLAAFYDELAPLIERYVDRHASLLAGVPGAQASLQEVIEALYLKLMIEFDEVHVSKGTELWERMHGEPPQPFQYTILDVNPLLMGSRNRAIALSGIDPVKDRYIHDWWRDAYDAYLDMNARQLLEMTTPVTKKLNRFAASDVARRIFGQPNSTIDLPSIIQDGGILLVDLAAGVIGQETAALIGSTLLNWLASILFAQQETRHGGNTKRRSIYVIVDEFQSIPGAAYTFMLSELAKFGARLFLGTQSLAYLAQMNPKTRAAWLANTSTLFVFRCGAEDADHLAPELSVGDEDRLTVTPADIVGLPDFACFVRSHGPSREPFVFRVETRKVDEGSDETLARIRARSRAVYGRDMHEVDEWLKVASDFQGEPNLVAAAASLHAQRPKPPAVINSLAQLPADREQAVKRLATERAGMPDLGAADVPARDGR
jgi:hypothetical protein